MPEMIENPMVIDSLWESSEKPICCCSDCEADLYEGETVYEIDGEIYCEDCFIDVVKDLYRKELTC